MQFGGVGRLSQYLYPVGGDPLSTFTIVRIRVVFPHPEGPSRPVIDPVDNLQEIPCSISLRALPFPHVIVKESATTAKSAGIFGACVICPPSELAIFNARRNQY